MDHSIELVKEKRGADQDMLALCCEVLDLKVTREPSRVDELFRAFTEHISAQQQRLMEDEYFAVLDALDDYEAGRGGSFRQIDIPTAVIAYRIAVTEKQIKDGFVTIELPSAEYMYRKKKPRGNKRAVYSQQRVALRSSIEPTLPTVEGELVSLLQNYHKERAEFWAAVGARKALAQGESA